MTIKPEIGEFIGTLSEATMSLGTLVRGVQALSVRRWIAWMLFRVTSESAHFDNDLCCYRTQEQLGVRTLHDSDFIFQCFDLLRLLRQSREDVVKNIANESACFLHVCRMILADHEPESIQHFIQLRLSLCV